MLYFRLTTAFLCGVVVLSLAACSDPTSVGSGVGPDSLSGGDPTTEEIVPSTLETHTTPARTGYNVPATVPSDQRREWRFLSGSVDDPLAGTVEANGYVDFLGSAARPDAVREASVDSLNAELRLVPTYLHGDTTSTLAVDLFDVSVEAEMDRAPADTSFLSEAQAIDSYSISPTDSLVTLPLPRAWIQEHQAALQDTSAFEDSFHGFEIKTGTGNNVVVGFDHGRSTLRVNTSTDTVDFAVQKSFSHIERRNPPPSQENRVVLLDGVGIGLKMAWDDSSLLDSLRTSNTPLTRADITVPIDTMDTRASLEQAPAGFTRPLPNGYRMLGNRAADGPSCGRLGLPAQSENTDTCLIFTNPEWPPAFARAASQTAFAIFDYSFFNPTPLRSFRIEVAARESENLQQQQTAQRGLPSTLPVVVRTGEADTENLPRATLIVTPL